MSEDKDKRIMWKMLQDPTYGILLPIYNANKKKFEEVNAVQTETDNALMKKLNKALGKLDD